MPSPGVISAAWLQAIDGATDCLRRCERNGRERAGGGDPSHEVMSSMAYLSQLEAWILALPDETWHSPPSLEPIAIVGPWDHQQSASIPRMTSSRMIRRNFSTENPYASIASSDDETSEREDDMENEAGDEVLLEPTAIQGMTLLRLLIRIRTTISDLWSHRSKELADAHAWTDACVSLVHASSRSRDAMFLADSQISRYFQREQEGLGGGSSSSRLPRKALEQDADIVHVAIQSVVRMKDRYQELANRQIAKLERILQPQWESRDEVKSRMGLERWNNNPSPKRDYAALRDESERELRQLQKAMESLEEADVDELEKLVLSMKSRLKDGTGHRYNGRRPEEVLRNADVGRIGGYPDATEYGWTFSGSNPASRVEFFEKTLDDDDGSKLIKLDWYYTTATIKTAMNHPRQGKTQLFAKVGVTPDLYVQILENPRVHTERRYQRKGSSGKKKKKQNRRDSRQSK
ncbi:hypothetical protein ACHAXA_010157 [Cyclostephanos tholiformis]|uniref:Uncharacterized protein n=1 Tax=Cyclostephanos tholiformis TaxID=382380 RepID=A0ABD3R3G8_9STRA